MDRRGFLGATGASALTLASSGAVSPLLALPSSRPSGAPPPLDDHLMRMDDGMDRLSRWTPTVTLEGLPGGEAEGHAMLRTSLQTLFLTGMVADLPLETQIKPEVQQRVHAAIPTMDEATDRTLAFLRSRTPADLQKVQTILQDRTVGARIGELLDQRAAEAGLSEWRRSHTRAMFEQAEWRLRTQPPASMVTELVEKVERVTESDLVGESRARQLAARLGEEAFWQQANEDLRQRRLSRGARLMGYGVLTFAVGGGIVAAGAFEGVFVMTVGAVLFLVGIVIALVGAATPRS